MGKVTVKPADSVAECMRRKEYTMIKKHEVQHAI